MQGARLAKVCIRQDQNGTRWIVDAFLDDDRLHPIESLVQWEVDCLTTKKRRARRELEHDSFATLFEHSLRALRFFVVSNAARRSACEQASIAYSPAATVDRPLESSLVQGVSRKVQGSLKFVPDQNGTR